MNRLAARVLAAGARPARPWLVITRPWWWALCRCGHFADVHHEPAEPLVLGVKATGAVAAVYLGCMGAVGPEFCDCPRFRRNWFGRW